MFKYIIFLSFLLISLPANELSQESKISYEETISTLKSIQDNALVYGSGDKLVYVFLDPLCPYSRKFISLVANNEKMRLKYRYAIYLYSIPRLRSTGAVAAIYKAKNQIETLLKIMLDDAKLSSFTNESIEKKIMQIESVGKKLNVKKRPFLIVQK